MGDYMSSVKMIDHHAEVLANMNANISRASQAIGTQAVGMIVSQMQGGYGSPIRQTGNLMRDVNFLAEEGSKTTITVGNSLFYAPFVHEGTSRMAGRPYIKDALQKGWSKLQETWAAYLKAGF